MKPKTTSDSEVKAAFRQLKPILVRATLFSALVNFLGLAPVAYTKEVYGPIVNSQSGLTLFWVTALLLAFVLLTGFLEWVRSKMFAQASFQFGKLLGQRVFDATFRANLGTTTPGSQQALQHLRVIKNFIASPTMASLIDAPLALSILLLVFYVNPRMGLVSSLSAVVMFLIGTLTESKVRPVMNKAMKASNEAQTYVHYAARNAQVIEAMGMLNNVKGQWNEIHQDFIQGQAEASDTQISSSAASKFVTLSQSSFMLGIGCWLTINGYLTDGGAAMIIASMLGGRAIAPTMQVISGWKHVVMVRDAYENLDAFLAKVPERQYGMTLPTPVGRVVFENAVIRSPDKKTLILQDLSLIVPAGTSLAVIGPSASGKSSLAKVLVGIWPTASGNVRLDGYSIYDWNKVDLGPYIGYLPQDIELFDGSLADNIARFGEVDEGAVARALDQVGMTEWLSGLPDGMHTLIGDDGIKLSGGQRQRIGLARAIYGEPRLVVLDEPNSSLDQQGDEALAQTLLMLKQKRCTVVVVTHRKEILSLLDGILMVHSGKPIMFGPRDKVLAKLAEAEKAGLPAASAGSGAAEQQDA